MKVLLLSVLYESKKKIISQEPSYLWIIFLADPISYDLSTVKIDFTKHLDSQKSLQNWGIVKSSTNSNIMVDLLQFADSIRYNLPVSQLSENNKQLKQTDIRYLFGNPKILKGMHF